MHNPWLNIPLSDYEGHMSLPAVAQAQLLADLFAAALTALSPASAAVLGCAGGNGFDRIAPQVTQRLVGIDLNPEYIQEARRRFQARIPMLELFAGDIQKDPFDFLPVDLVFAGLLFEYVDVDRVLARICSMLNRPGWLVTVVQLPNANIPEVTPSPYTSLGSLSPFMHLVPPGQVESLAAAHGYQPIGAQTVEAAGGKSFRVQTFCLPVRSTST